MSYRITNPLMCTQKEADDVLLMLQEYLDAIGYVTVERLYDAVFMLDDLRGPYDFEYGWTDLSLARVEFSNRHGAYEILMPGPIQLTPQIVNRSHIPNDGSSTVHVPKTVAEITVCGAVKLCVTDIMGFIKPTPEQIKNLHDMLCIDVKLYDEED